MHKNAKHVRANIPREGRIKKAKKESRSIDRERGEMLYNIFRVHFQSFASFLSPRGNHIDYRQGLAPLPPHSTTICFDSVYRSPPFLSFFQLLLFSWALPSSPTPYGGAVRSLRRSVFTNFISFLWGIKSSRSRPREGKKRNGRRGFPTSKLVPPSLFFPSLRRPVVTWLGGAVFNPLVLGNHVWGKKRRDAHQGLGREGDFDTRGEEGWQPATGSLSRNPRVSWLIKKFPNRPPPYLLSSRLKFHPLPSPLHACTRNPVSKQIRAALFLKMDITLSEVIVEAFWKFFFFFLDFLIFVSLPGWMVSWLILMFSLGLFFPSFLNALLGLKYESVRSNFYSRGWSISIFLSFNWRMWENNFKQVFLKRMNCWYGLLTMINVFIN